MSDPTEPMPPTPPPTGPPAGGTEPPGGGSTTRARLLYGLVGAVVAIAVALVLVLLLRDDGDEVATDDTTTTTAEVTTTLAPTTTEAPTTTTTVAPTTTAPPTTVAPRTDTATVVFPFAEESRRFDDPMEVASAFAEDYVGFSDPIYSEYRAGDSRSGEIGVRPMDDGPETTILVRQLEDDHWWVIGAVTDNIVVDEPAAGDVVTSPLEMTGEALAFEGTVNVELWPDLAEEPLAEGIAQGGGDVMRPFANELTWTGDPGTRYGALVFRTYSMEDGSVWEATVFRVAFS